MDTAEAPSILKGRSLYEAALALRGQGLLWKEVAYRLGVNQDSLRGAVQKWVRRNGNDNRGGAEMGVQSKA